MRSNRVRNVLATVSALALLTAASGAMAQASDPLVQLMIKKKFITSNEAAGLKSRDDLAQLLVKKKYITAQEAAGLPPPPPPVVVAAPPPALAPAPAVAAAPPPLIAAGTGGSPFAFRVGAVNFQIGGFLDFETIVRSSNSTNSGSSFAGTNFGGTAFSNTVQGHQRDFHMTAEMTRFSLKATTNFMGNDVTAYGEMDFHGNDPSNVNVNTNSHTARLRLAYVDVNRGPFEVTAGQVWSLVTPNRNGLSTAPNDIFTTYNFDANYIVGLNWARQAGIRAIWHPNQNLALGIGLENPDQFIGSSLTTFPAAFNAQLGGQFDNTSLPGAPAFAPDLIPKVAYDGNPLGMHLHAEALGLFRAYRIAILPTVNATGFDHDTIVSKAGGVNANLEVYPGVSLIGGGMYGESIGRYAGALGPDVVVRPVPSGAGFTAHVSPVVGFSTVVGAEWKITPDDLVALYGGMARFQTNYTHDLTAANPAITYVGYGNPNSFSTENRTIKELSFDYIRTIWADPQYGMLKAGAQFSTVMRRPFFVAPGAPKDVVTHIGFLDLRYYLP